MLVKNKVIIITGGAKGIGITLSHKFAEAGAEVIITERDETAGNKVAAEIRAKGFTLILSRPMFPANMTRRLWPILLRKNTAALISS